MKFAWTPEAEDTLKRLHGTMPLQSIADILGTTKPSVRGKITKLGIAKKPLWSHDDIQALKEAYTSAGADGVVDLIGLAKSMGRDKANVCRKAKELGLVTNPNRRLVHQRKERPVNRKYDSEKSRSAAASERMRQRHKKRGHPMQGKKHTAEALKKNVESQQALLGYLIRGRKDG